MTPGALPDPIAVAVIVARKLEQLDVDYVIGGSFASSLHGEPRSTNDVDIVVHMDTAIKVDVFVAGSDPFDRERLRRRQQVHLDTSDVLFVDTAEDIVLRKLEWYRPGGEMSERQWRDVVAVLSAQRRLDDAYLDAWAGRLGVSDLLRRARVESASA